MRKTTVAPFGGAANASRDLLQSIANEFANMMPTMPKDTTAFDMGAMKVPRQLHTSRPTDVRIEAFEIPVHFSRIHL
ncbi:MAG: hypothetical protein GY791_06525 [Alphaproteobacteria bacterium]|nr:hypothetical protein [Alphaproteobacteria bacterium]